MQRLIDVFLSSTGLDLAEHRKAVRDRLQNSGVFHCIWQEGFGPQDAHAVDFCREHAQSAEWFVGLIGWRRGWEPDGDNAKRSITEMEHDWAKDVGRPRFMWVAPEGFSVPGHLHESKAQHSRQKRFRKRIMGERIVSENGFATPQQLASEIVEHLLKQVIIRGLMERTPSEPQEPSPPIAEAQVAPVAAAVEKLADDKDIDLLALAKDLQGADIGELQAKLTARAEAHEAAGRRERKISAEYWRHAGALAFLHDTQTALRAYAKATELDPDDVEGWNQLGHLQKRVGELDAAVGSYERVLALGNSSADQVAIAIATSNLGLIFRRRGDLDAAEAMHKKSLAIEEALDRKEGMASDYGNLGVIYQTRGDLDAAEAMLKKTMAIEEALGRKEGMANGYGNLGLIYGARGDLDAAEAMLKKALAIEEALGRKEGMARQNGNLGVIYQSRGDLDAAEAMLKKALAINEALGRREGVASDYGNLGVLYQLRGDLDTAEAMLEKALVINEALGRKEGMAMQYGNLGQVYSARGDLDQACVHWRRALQLFTEVGARPRMERIARLLHEAGCPEA